MVDRRIELHTLLLCDYALTAQDGKISAVGIFSQINVGSLPAVHGRCFIVAVLEAEPGEHELTLQVVSPRGTGILDHPPQLRIEVPQNATSANIVADLKGMRLEELGRLGSSCVPATVFWAALRSRSTWSCTRSRPETPEFDRPPHAWVAQVVPSS